MFLASLLMEKEVCTFFEGHSDVQVSLPVSIYSQHALSTDSVAEVESHPSNSNA